MLCELKGSINRLDTEAQDQLLQIITFRLATRGRSIQMGHERSLAVRQIQTSFSAVRSPPS